MRDTDDPPGAAASAARPLIAVTVGVTEETSKPTRYETPAAYTAAIRQAGGLAVLVPPVADLDEAEAVMARVDGLLLIGGADLPATLYGQSPHPLSVPMAPARVISDLALIAAALATAAPPSRPRRVVPILGICLGLQELNIAYGGGLHQHLPDVVGTTVDHTEDRLHPVAVRPGSRLAQMLFGPLDEPVELSVKSSHHQGLTDSGSSGIAALGRGLRTTALAPDGVIEAVETEQADRFVVAVQWHPERMIPGEGGGQSPPAGGLPPGDMRRLFAGFVAACRPTRG